MSPVVVDLAASRRRTSHFETIYHPAGVELPFDSPRDAELIIPEVRASIRAGHYAAPLIQHLRTAVRPGDRVLVIGAGLGVVSSLIAQQAGVERVIAAEASPALIPYLHRTHRLNAVCDVEVLHAVLAAGQRGRTPFFIHRDMRESSLLPDDRAWQHVAMVSYMDINLILAEEAITLIVCDIPVGTMALMTAADLSSVRRILFTTGRPPAGLHDQEELCSDLAQRGFGCLTHRKPGAPAMLFSRDILHG